MRADARHRWLLPAVAVMVGLIVLVVVISGGDGWRIEREQVLGGATGCGSVVARQNGPESTVARLLAPGPVDGVDPGIATDGFEIPRPDPDRPEERTLGVFVDGLKAYPWVTGCRVTLDGDTIEARFEWSLENRHLIYVTVGELPPEVRALRVNGRRFPLER